MFVFTHYKTESSHTSYVDSKKCSTDLLICKTEFVILENGLFKKLVD